eukprot:gene29505-35612_t
MSPITDESPLKKVAIVGCGIAGLAFAACMKVIPTGVEEIVVFDPHDDIVDYNAGGAIGLTSGAYILEKLGFIDQLKQYGKHIDQIRFVDNQENVLLDLNLQEIFATDKGKHFPPSKEKHPLAYTLRWSALRKLLYDCTFQSKENVGTKDSLDEVKADQKHGSDNSTRVIYRPRYRFQSLEEDPVTGKVALYFTNQMREENFDLVIGADGVRSTVRNFTAKPNETILTALPYGYNLSGAYGSVDTGLRVTQCVSPPKHDRLQFQAVAKKERMSEEMVFKSVDKLCKGRLQQICGNGCNFLTTRVGDFENTYYILGLIYRQSSFIGGENAGWIPDHRIKGDLEERLRRAGVSNFQELHALVEASTRPGGLIFDVGVRDHVFPLRFWCSISGRVILMGDSAHTEAPFLGQGANQSLQDAFCLASLLYEYNTNKRLALRDELCPTSSWMAYLSFSLPSLRSMVVWLLSLGWINQVIVRGNLLASWGLWKIIDLSQVRVSKPTKLQLMAYKYERIRKYHNTYLTWLARLLGYVETLGGDIGYFAKCTFFRLLHWTGLGKELFLGPIKPAV